MVKVDPKRLAILQDLARLKAEVSATEYAIQSKRCRHIEAEISALALMSKTSAQQGTEIALANVKHQAWAHQRRIELLSELSRERARTQPYKEAAQRDVARQNVLKKLCARTS